jgi:serine phosphatase RsbU (regulator of sigma subunit)
VECIITESTSIGTSRNIRPSITEFPLESGVTIVAFTDGIFNAGDRTGQTLDICTLLTATLEEQEPTAQYIADTVLNQALRLDQNRPNDDMSVVVMRIQAADNDQVRRMSVRLPVPPTYPY